MAAVELQQEPDGGTELVPVQSMTETRVKRMEELPDTKENDGPAFRFWMSSVAESSLISGIRTQILKDAAKKANFPGFRKGQVPPYAQPQITQFAIQESLIKTIEAVVDGYGLKSLKGSDGKVDVHEDVSAMSKAYKNGDSIAFTASFKATFDPEKQSSATNDSASDDIDNDSPELSTEATLSEVATGESAKEVV